VTSSDATKETEINKEVLQKILKNDVSYVAIVDMGKHSVDYVIVNAHFQESG
jgi:hypothetical protein